METIIVIIIIAILVLFVIPFVRYYFTINPFYKKVVKEYWNYRFNIGYDRIEANTRIIKRLLTGNSLYRISDEAQLIISTFDIADTIQFLIFFNNGLTNKFDSIPKLSSSGKNQNTREKILQFAFSNEQFQFLNRLPDLRANKLDFHSEFISLGEIIISDLKLHYRCEQK